MKGIILAGGRGTRMYPMTVSVSKQLLPVYDKPTIYYPLTTLMECGINDILIITNPPDVDLFKNLLEPMRSLGLNLSYLGQENPTSGIAQAVVLAEEFLDGSDFCLILGDNILIGDEVKESIAMMKENFSGCHIFGINVDNPSQFGVLEIEGDSVVSIEEKPVNPKSNYAVPGIYFYDNKAVEYANSLKPSERGELEITDLNNIYLKLGTLKATLCDKVHWYDTGSPNGLYEASSRIKELQDSGIPVGVPELVALDSGWISTNNYKNLESYKNNKTKYSSMVRGGLQ